jgi:hemerythrin HHE cation binding domain-containing protein
MRHRSIAITSLACVVVATVATTFGTATDAAQGGQKVTIPIPQSLQVEHRAIHEALEAAIKAPGRTGAAAREVAAVLGPHFKREDEIALPPLGLLAPLARGERPAGMSEALAMSDALRKELPRMLAEHKQIRAATEKLRDAAREEKATLHEQFAAELLRHAQSEEEVLYPAAVLVGDIIRARTTAK